MNYELINKNCPYFYDNNKPKSMVIHCISIHPDGEALDEKGNLKRTFKSVEDATEFCQDSYNYLLHRGEKPYKISYNEVILYDGSVISFLDDSKGGFHAGKAVNKFKNKTFLNRHSIGLALFRDATQDDYYFHQYQSLIQRINLRNFYLNDLVLHKDLDPNRKTDPDNFNFNRLIEALYDKE